MAIVEHGPAGQDRERREELSPKSILRLAYDAELKEHRVTPRKVQISLASVLKYQQAIKDPEYSGTQKLNQTRKAALEARLRKG